MRKLFYYVLALQIFAGSLCPGQVSEFPPNSQPASSNVRGGQYPRVTSDLRAVFQIKAPKAQKVQIQIPTSPNVVRTYDMVRDAQGVWTVTTDPQVPGFHYYTLFIDSVAVADPASMSFYGNNRMASGIEIPEAGVDFYTVKNVPHGDVRSRWYYSKVTETWRRCYVYCPPYYNNNLKKKYPVFYLQHGGGENEGGWVIQGRVDIILDNLISEGKTVPMIIVMDQGYAVKPGAPVQTAPAAPGASQQSAGPTAFEEVMIKDLITFIDATFRTYPDRDHRAMAGLSMGGGQTLQITTRNLDKFAYIGGFSGAARITTDTDLKTVYNGVFADAAAFNNKIKLLWIGIGTTEAVNMYAGVNGFHLALLKAGINHVYYESPGTAHEWLTWRRDLYQFAPLLFKK